MAGAGLSAIHLDRAAAQSVLAEDRIATLHDLSVAGPPPQHGSLRRGLNSP